MLIATGDDLKYGLSSSSLSSTVIFPVHSLRVMVYVGDRCEQHP